MVAVLQLLDAVLKQFR
ncbi:hypothetical protein K4G96_27135, partial [Mycobacterium tuberculosis]|nr:hypothetical protein [Mycobacterium tuberculosis]